MKSNWLIRGLIIVVLLAIVGIVYMKNSETTEPKETVKAEAFSYEILDVSVELPEDINAWVEEKKVKDGFYTKATKEETFVLMSGGKQDTTGYGISLNKVEQEGLVLHVDYEVMKPSKEDEVQKEETIPFMLLRVNSEKAEVKGKIAPLEDESSK